MKKIQISPSILSADFSQLGNEIKRLEEGGADMIHVGCHGWSFCA
jgi:ribulose-phosphate 3-epimerase